MPQPVTVRGRHTPTPTCAAHSGSGAALRKSSLAALRADAEFAKVPESDPMSDWDNFRNNREDPGPA